MNKNAAPDPDDSRIELENRIKNLLWTVSGDYGLEMKPDTALFLRSEDIALYDGIKQGAFASSRSFKVFLIPAKSANNSRKSSFLENGTSWPAIEKGDRSSY